MNRDVVPGEYRLWRRTSKEIVRVLEWVEVDGVPESERNASWTPQPIFQLRCEDVLTGRSSFELRLMLGPVVSELEVLVRIATADD